MSRLGVRYLVATVMLTLLAQSGHAQTATGVPTSEQTAEVPSSDWHVSIEPYLWLSGLDGKVTSSARRSLSADESFGDLLGQLNAALMVLGTIEYRRFVLIADFDWANLTTKSNDLSPFFSETKIHSESYMGTAAGGYRLVDSPSGTLDGMLGVRVMSMDTTATFDAGLLRSASVSNDDTWADPVVALQGSLPIGRGFFARAYSDVGGGPGSDLTWQVFGAVGYNITQRITALVGYRYLSTRHVEDRLTLDLQQHGPIFSIGAHF